MKPVRMCSVMRPPRSAKAVLLLAAAVAGCGWAEAAPPNIVLVSIENLRADHVGAYGYDRATTPNLDLLASEGVIFWQHYSQAPGPVPSRLSLLTSRYPSDHGVWQAGDELATAALSRDIPLVVEALRDEGYATALLTQRAGDGLRDRFSEYRELRSLRDRRIVEEDIELLAGWLRGVGSRPFFVFVTINETGLPYEPPDDHAWFFSPRYQGPLPTRITREMASAMSEGSVSVSDDDRAHVASMYDAEILLVDEWLGAFMARLREAGLEASTLLAITSTNGERLGGDVISDNEGGLDEALLHTPLILAGPGVPAGVVVATPSRSIDVAPTLLELANVPIPASYEGDSLRALWSGGESAPRRVVAELPDSRWELPDSSSGPPRGAR